MTQEQIDILHHTEHRAAGGLYCGGCKDMDALVVAGLMESAGRKSFVPDEYFRITAAGRNALKERHMNQSSPRYPKEAMKAYCYTRTENSTTAGELRLVLRDFCKLHDMECAGFFWDAMSGQRGLNQTLRKAEPGDTIVVNRLTDLGKDVPGLVKQIDALLAKDISVWASATALYFSVTLENAPEPRIIRALAQAHVHYVTMNRMRGIASAREAGAVMGRPTDARFHLDAAREVIANLTSAKAGGLPSWRKLAKELGCGQTRAGQLLKEYAAEKTLSNEPESGES